MKVALAQIDTTVGDVAGNLEKVRSNYRKAAGLGAELIVFPELALAGYPAWDLLEQRDFIDANLAALKRLARETKNAALCVGFVDRNPAKIGKPLFNALAVLHKGKILAKRYKSLLPTYDVFDERRYFEPAAANAPIPLNGVKIGFSICEDAWNDDRFWRKRLYDRDPLKEQARAGAKLLINISASPFHRGKAAFRRRMLQSHARGLKRPLLFCNLVGGNDDLVFDGNSVAFNAKGRLIAGARGFEEDLIVIDPFSAPEAAPMVDEPQAAEVFHALVLGLRDYTRKCGFKDVLVGLSGGIDSAVVAALAAAALGPEHVLGISMPSMYSSQGSKDDARKLAENLGIRLETYPINTVFESYLGSLRSAFGGKDASLAEQNLQARIRGNLLMALSNQRGALLLSTGNKSELSVGYCTLYGDMSGGLAVIGDVPKMTVYALAKHINREREVIPQASIDKPPSAELKPGQKDQDDLPPYELLDDVVQAYVEDERTPAEIARRGHDPKLVADILRRIDSAEYKRRQAAPVLKITPKAFGVGRRMPIARGRFRWTHPGSNA